MSKTKRLKAAFDFEEKDLFNNEEDFTPLVSGSSKEDLLRAIGKAVEENIFAIESKLEEKNG